MATVLGANSPITTCIKVTIAKAIPNVRIWVTDSFNFKWIKSGCSNFSTVGSPNHPSPNAVTVMPSWQADKYSSRCETTCFAASAPFLPSDIN